MTEHAGEAGAAIVGIIVGTIIGEKWHPWGWVWTVIKVQGKKLLRLIGLG